MLPYRASRWVPEVPEPSRSWYPANSGHPLRWETCGGVKGNVGWLAGARTRCADSISPQVPPIQQDSCMSPFPSPRSAPLPHGQLSIICMNRRRPIDSKLALDGRRPRRQIQGMTLLMHRVDPGNNAYRFYALSLEPTLFGDVALVRRWGRIGTRGRQIIELHPDEASASTALQRHRLIRLRHGYRAI
ncbi:putative DNA-binding WGR domain protein [Aminobacter sp. J44]|jgi:predicted DNA-binding WGR domain protein|nr:putative DNA-binding WGR domain protein [Aminobacter sp. J44]